MNYTEPISTYNDFYNNDNTVANPLLEFTEISEPISPFFRIPKELISSDEYLGLSVTAKFLYGILLDRQTLSKKNGWRDRYGNVYVFATLTDVRKTLNCSEKTAVKVLKELETYRLIRKVRRGWCMPNLIYVKDLLNSFNSTRAL